MRVHAEGSGSSREHRPQIRVSPSTTLGRWAVGLALSFFPFVLAARTVPRGAAFGFVVAWAGGIAALIAILRDKDRSVIVFAALVPLVVTIAFVLAELIGGNA